MKQLSILFVLFSLNIFPHHLPLQPGNQWHYDSDPRISRANAAIAVDALLIYNKIYYIIECSEPITNNPDRIDHRRLYSVEFKKINTNQIKIGTNQNV